VPADQPTDPPAVYPTGAEVENATLPQLLGWNRFLPSPRTGHELVIAERILARMQTARFVDPGAYLRTSRTIGWKAAA
jgi:hypothetical protein